MVPDRSGREAPGSDGLIVSSDPTMTPIAPYGEGLFDVAQRATPLKSWNHCRGYRKQRLVLRRKNHGRSWISRDPQLARLLRIPAESIILGDLENRAVTAVFRSEGTRGVAGNRWQRVEPSIAWSVAFNAQTCLRLAIRHESSPMTHEPRSNVDNDSPNQHP